MHATRPLDNVLANDQAHCVDVPTDDDSSKCSSGSNSAGSEFSDSSQTTSETCNNLPQLHVMPKTVVEKRNKATRIQMEKEWRASPLCFGDSCVVIDMRRSIMYKNVYEQYNCYLDQVFEKHSEYFSERIVAINNRKQKKDGNTLEYTTPQDVVYFQYDYRHKLTGRRGRVYMGFSKDNVKEQFGLSLKKLFIFMLGAEGYRSGIEHTTVSSKCLVEQLKTPKCIIEQLKTRMLFNWNVDWLRCIDLDLPSVLSEAIDVISKLTTTTSDVNLPSVLPEDVDDVEVISKLTTTTSDTPKAFTSNTTKWEQSEEYRLDSEMIERSKLLGLLECIDVYFRWYMKLVSEKHKAKFTQRIAEINKESSMVPNGYTITVVDNHLALGLLDFLLHFEDALQNGEACMGFSKREVDGQYGITLESLFTFNECAEQYVKSGIKIYGDIDCCNACNLITRLKSTEYRAQQSEFSDTMDMVQILYKTLEAASELSVLPSKCDVKLQLQMLREAEEDENDTDKKQEESMNHVPNLIDTSDRLKVASVKTEVAWKDSEEYRLDSEMIERSKLLGLLECIDVYFQWYMTQISEKRKAKFTQRIAEINKESSKVPNGYTITVVDNHLALGLLDFLLHFEDALQNGEACMGFSKREVDGQYGITLESLFTFNECAEQHLKSGVTIYGDIDCCNACNLITRLKSTEYRAQQSEFSDTMDMVQILYQTLEAVSELSTPDSKCYVKLQEALQIASGEISPKTQIQMEQEWRASPLCFGDLDVVDDMRRSIIYKNVYEQYNCYLDQVFKKHSEYFSERMAEINESKRKRGLKRKCETLQHVVYFQEESQRELTGRRGGVYMGFSEDNVKEQFGLSLKKLFIFMLGAEGYRNGIEHTHKCLIEQLKTPQCIIEQLKTRMLFHWNVDWLRCINLDLPSVLSEAVDVISKLTTTTSDVNLPSVLPEDVDDVEVISKLTTTTSDTPKAFTSNTTKWEQSEEYRLDSEMIEKSKQLEAEEDEHDTDKKQEESMNHVPNLIDTSDRLKVASVKTEEAWEESEEYRLDSEMVEKSKQVGLNECINAYFQWYMTLVSEKHKDKFTQRIAEINKESSKVPNGYTITVVDNNVALALLDFLLHFEDVLLNDEVCMGFSKSEVDSQYAITLESLFTFNECAEQHLKSGIKIYVHKPECVVSDLITRLKSTEYRAYQGKFNCNMVQILDRTLEVVSKLSAPDSKLYVKLQEALQIVSGEISPKTQIQMEKEWRASQLYFRDSRVVDTMRKNGIYKNVHDQYNWYLDQVFERHSEQFSTYMKRINNRKPTKKRVFSAVPRVCTTPQHVVRFQEENKHQLIERDGVCMGFDTDNVKEQFGLSLESLLTFMEYSWRYSNGMITYTAASRKCLIAQLKTRMLSTDYSALIGFDLSYVLSEAVGVIYKLAATSSDTP